jgi:hypothetical protein
MGACLASPDIGLADAIVRFDADTVYGAPGERQAVTVSFGTDLEVVGFENEVSFAAPAPLAAGVNGRPDCTAASGLGFASFAFRPFGCTPGLDCTSVRASFITLGPVEPIPPGMVYTCTVVIDPDAAAGSYPIAFTAGNAQDANGNDLPVEGIDGAVVVSGGADGDGCQVGVVAGRASWQWWTLVASAAWLIARRRTRSDDAPRRPRRPPGARPAPRPWCASWPFVSFVAQRRAGSAPTSSSARSTSSTVMRVRHS